MAYCKSCGAKIVWGITKNGKKVPLDAESEKRYILKAGGTSNEVILRSTYMTHFVTCPNADSHRNKKEGKKSAWDKAGESPRKLKSLDSNDFEDKKISQYSGSHGVLDDELPF